MQHLLIQSSLFLKMDCSTGHHRTCTHSCPHLELEIVHDSSYKGKRNKRPVPSTLIPLVRQFWKCTIEQNETNATKLLRFVYFPTCLHLRKRQTDVCGSMQVTEREILNLFGIRLIRSVGLLLYNKAFDACVNKMSLKTHFSF